MRAYIEGIVLAALAIVALWGAWQVPAASPGDTWAGIVPFAAALALLILSGVLLFGGKAKPAEGPETKEDTGTLSILALFVIALFYQQSFRWFGYLLPTALVAPVVLYMFGVRSWIGLAVSIIACPIVFHIIFFELLGVFPPYGEVFDLLDWIKG